MLFSVRTLWRAFQRAEELVHTSVLMSQRRVLESPPLTPPGLRLEYPVPCALDFVILRLRTYRLIRTPLGSCEQEVALARAGDLTSRCRTELSGRLPHPTSYLLTY